MTKREFDKLEVGQSVELRVPITEKNMPNESGGYTEVFEALSKGDIGTIEGTTKNIHVPSPWGVTYAVEVRFNSLPCSFWFNPKILKVL